MERILSLIILVSSLFPGALSAQKRDLDLDLQTMKSHCWTDGFEFVNYTSRKDAEEIWNMNVEDHDALLFIGGTLHEGGSCLFVKHDDCSIWVDDKQTYQLFPPGDKITFDSKREILLFRDADNGSLHGILKSLRGTEALNDLRDMTIRNIRRLGVAGKYRDDTGKSYVFSPDKNEVQGLSAVSSTYTLAEIFDFPNPILIFPDVTYAVSKTSKGLELTLVRSFGDEGFYEPIPDRDKIFLKRVKGPMDCDYPLLSKEYFTLHELIVYGGDPYATLGISDTKPGIASLIETLSIMRNEIFARHGYIFKSGKWKQFFGPKKWYKPTKSDVTSELSEIEKTNIELLLLQEKKFKELLKETE